MDGSKEMGERKKRSPVRGCGFPVLCGDVFRRRSRTLPRRPSSAPGTPSVPRAAAAAKLAPFNVGRRRGEEPDRAPLVGPGDSPAPSEKLLLSPNSQMAGQQKAAPQKSRPAVQVPTISMELDSMLYDHQRAKESSTLIRASSGNVMLFGNLGNLRVRNAASSPARNLLEDVPNTTKEAPSSGKTRLGNVGGGIDAATGSSSNVKESAIGRSNSVKKPPTGRSSNAKEPAPVPMTSPALSKRVVPEELNHMGSVEYRKGRLAEALAFFEQATVVAPGRALYWNNKAVVLTSLGRLLEAVISCREAVEIDPSYCRAHRRLAILYLRLGEAERSMHHHKQAGGESSARDIARGRSLQNHMTKCSEARKRKDWQTMLREAQFAISVGADSAPMVFASQAEALLRLQRHQEAETALVDAPTLDIDASTKFFGAAANAYILMVQAQVGMAFGRFDAALSTAKRAAQIDPRNTETGAVARRVNAVSLARMKGNDLFKASKFGEACAAYGEGLDHDPHNSVLLCNRAACKSKLGQWEKAIADCNLALSVRPSYKEARLRRADCYAKVEKWEDSIQDYKVLIQQFPGDDEVLKALDRVHSQVKERDTEGKDKNSCANTVVVNANDQLTHLPT